MPPALCKPAGIFHTFFAVFVEISCFFPELCVAYSGADCQRNRSDITRLCDILIILSITYGQIFFGFCRNLKLNSLHLDTLTLRKNAGRINGGLFFSLKGILTCLRLLIQSEESVI